MTTFWMEECSGISRSIDYSDWESICSVGIEKQVCLCKNGEFRVLYIESQMWVGHTEGADQQEVSLLSYLSAII